MLLVTGGSDTTTTLNGVYLDSTELLVPGSGSWRLVNGTLPRLMTGVRIDTIANIMYLTGKSLLFCDYIGTGPVACTDVCLCPGGEVHGEGLDSTAYDEILQFHPDTEEWTLTGRMIEARSSHAVSSIFFEDVRDYCIM